jgi:hypothetical protein
MPCQSSGPSFGTVLARPVSNAVMKVLSAGLALCMALAADGRAQPLGSPRDVTAALERIRDTGIFPEYLSLEYVEVHRAVTGIVERDPHGYVADLAGRVLTRVVVNIRNPLIPSDEQPFVTADFLDGPEQGRMHRADIYGSLDGGPWRLVTGLGYGGSGALGAILCGEGTFGPSACAPGWHAIAMRAVVSAWAGDSSEPVWSETRQLPVQVYGVYRKTDLTRFPPVPVSGSTPAAWMRAVLEAPASFIDSQLSSFPLPQWVDSTLRAAGRPDLAQSMRWESRPCGVDMVERFADRSRAPVCIAAQAAGRDDELSLEFSVGPLVGETGPHRWPEAAVFHQGQLGRSSREPQSLPAVGAACGLREGEIELARRRSAGPADLTSSTRLSFPIPATSSSWNSRCTTMVGRTHAP